MKKTALVVLFFIFTFQLYSQSSGDSLVKPNKGIKSLFGSVISWYTDNLNYGTVTLLMVVESSFFIPFPSEVVVPPAAYAACNPQHGSLYVTDNKFINVSLVVVFATLGALIGAFINYFIAFFLGRPVIYWFADSRVGHLLLLNGNKIKKAENYFVVNGNASTFIGRLIPGIRQLISVPAGLAKMKLAPFAFYTFLGAGIWNVILAILGYIAHGQQDMIDKYSEELSWLLLLLGCAFIGWLFFKHFRKKNRNERQNLDSPPQKS